MKSFNFDVVMTGAWIALTTAIEGSFLGLQLRNPDTNANPIYYRNKDGGSEAILLPGYQSKYFTPDVNEVIENNFEVKGTNTEILYGERWLASNQPDPT